MFKYKMTITTDRFIQVAYFRNYYEMFTYLERELNRYDELGKPNKYFPTFKPIVTNVTHEKIEMDDLYKSFINWLNEKYSEEYFFYHVCRDDCVHFMWTREKWPYNTDIIISNLLEMFQKREDGILYFS